MWVRRVNMALESVKVSTSAENVLLGFPTKTDLKLAYNDLVDSGLYRNIMLVPVDNRCFNKGSPMSSTDIKEVVRTWWTKPNS